MKSVLADIIYLSKRNFSFGQINDNFILGIIHYTIINNLDSILKSKYLKGITELKTNKEEFQYVSSFDDRILSDDEFPGVFTSLIIKPDINKYLYNKELITDYKGNIINEKKTNIYLIFSKKLLNQDNYHFRPFDNMGKIDNDAYSKKNFNKGLENLIENYDNKDYRNFYTDMSINELVFHNKITIDALEEIWIPDEENFKLLQEKYPEYSNLMKYQETIPDKYYNKEIILDTSSPNFCFYNSSNFKCDKNRLNDNCGETVTKQNQYSIMLDRVLSNDKRPKNIKFEPPFYS